MGCQRNFRKRERKHERGVGGTVDRLGGGLKGPGQEPLPGPWEVVVLSDGRFRGTSPMLRAAEIREQFLPRFKSQRAPKWCEFDFTTVAALQESTSEAWVREAQALDRGAITINEWRAKQGYPAVPWGDKPYMPVNKAPLKEDGSLDLPEPAVGAKPPDDEANPSNPAPQTTGAKSLDHNAARALLASFRPLNGVKL